MNLKYLLFPLACLMLRAQEPVHWSTEVDLLPMATGGWYGSLARGEGYWRLRGVMAEVHIPSAFAPKGWTDARTRAGALLVDGFFRRNFQGPWVGGGVEDWVEHLSPAGSPGRVRLHTEQGTLGAGWVYRMGPHFTLNPWMAVHKRLGGDVQAVVAGRVCKPQAIQEEASVKLGWSW